MDFNLIVNVLLQNQANQKADMPLIRMSSVIQVKSGHCRLANAISRQSHAFLCNLENYMYNYSCIALKCM